ncbi:MAG: hypothetical protein MSC31_14465 [Solirubrobacteraceae bacterium MAG38_C4-C5]|nr:hypothetical protein [Candidatus Siliceabacter maunaloa]
MRIRWLAFLLANCVLAQLASTTTAHADEIIAREQRPTPISSYGDRAAWSSYDSSSDAFRLMTRVGGVTSMAPISARSQAFDVDLGENSSGEAVAAYSRCQNAFPMPLGQAQRRPSEGCDIYVLNLATGTESKLEGPSTHESSEYLPTIAGDQVAFVRVYERRPGRRGQLPYLYLRDLVGERPSSRLPGGARGLTDRPGPTSLNLNAEYLVFAWDRLLDRNTYRSQVRVDEVNADEHRMLLQTTRDDQPGGLISPSFAGSWVLFGEWGAPTGSRDELYRVDPQTGGGLFASAPPLLSSVAATDNGDGYFYVKAVSLREDGSQSCQGGGCEIGRIDQIPSEGFFAE